MTAPSDHGTLRRVVVKHAREAFGDPASIEAQWRSLGYRAAPDLGRAIAESDALVDLLERRGVRVELAPAARGVGLDSLYVRDAALVAAHGAVLGRMGKPARRGEPAALGSHLQSLGIPIAGRIEAPGTLEGGDVAWLDARTVAVGQGYRTNATGIEQLRRLLGDSIDELVVVPLPHHRGPSDVFHLMSILSPLDRDLLLVYSPLLPVPFRQWLLDRGYRLVETAGEELDSLGCNSLALAPRTCLLTAGNPRTRDRLERAGVEVVELLGDEIAIKGGGGPTCLTRPLEWDA